MIYLVHHLRWTLHIISIIHNSTLSMQLTWQLIRQVIIAVLTCVSLLWSPNFPMTIIREERQGYLESTFTWNVSYFLYNIKDMRLQNQSKYTNEIYVLNQSILQMHPSISLKRGYYNKTLSLRTVCMCNALFYFDHDNYLLWRCRWRM